MSESFGLGPGRYAIGDRVWTTRPLRQDGTFPDPRVPVGQVLVDEGTSGQVVDIGVYLNEHLVYAVAFDNGRLVGCLERELEVSSP
jgi:nitrogen fixation protein NifZ